MMNNPAIARYHDCHCPISTLENIHCVFQPHSPTIHSVAGSLGIDVSELRPLLVLLALLFCLFLPSNRSIHFRIDSKLL